MMGWFLDAWDRIRYGLQDTNEEHREAQRREAERLADEYLIAARKASADDSGALILLQDPARWDHELPRRIAAGCLLDARLRVAGDSIIPQADDEARGAAARGHRLG